jgi:hypothetical protein
MSERDGENPSGLPSPTGASAGSSSPDMSRPERPSRVDKETQTDQLDSNGNVVSPQDQPPQPSIERSQSVNPGGVVSR